MLAAKHLAMPTGPKGQKRQNDVASNAVRIMQIATGQREEINDAASDKNPAAVTLGRMGGEARAKSLSSKKLKKIASNAAKARWKKKS